MLGYLGRALLLKEQMEVLSIIQSPISRSDKNRMRKNLEEILVQQKELEKRIANFQKEEKVEDYRVFWQELKGQYNQNTQTVSNYMVRKCNR
ncbi:MAG: hypothetical protein CVU90_06515 [Firmicutes bacterium HGW-Firmicutes-15]|nr:MAG: hypothetical protein CVU90_06515 [Firmicutes bacterium HGW-Firmicutes-15]